jgi:hypothetical protein
MTRGVACAAVACASLLLQGCGNLYEHLAEGEWQEAGRNESPTPPSRGDFVVSTLEQGSGATVRAGDLVYARVRVVRPSVAPHPGEPVVFNAWLWSGASPSDDLTLPDRDTWADLGSPALRATLVGKRVGDRYSVVLEEAAETSGQVIPLYGLLDSWRSEPRNSLYPSLEIDRRPAELEILDTCPARLLRRTATLRQWGPMIRFFDSYYPTRRVGVLGWTALEAECTPSAIRFEIGPLYFKGHELLDWEASYARTRVKDSWLGLAARLLLGAAAFALAFGWFRRAQAR